MKKLAREQELEKENKNLRLALKYAPALSKEIIGFLSDYPYWEVCFRRGRGGENIEMVICSPAHRLMETLVFDESAVKAAQSYDFFAAELHALADKLEKKIAKAGAREPSIQELADELEEGL